MRVLPDLSRGCHVVISIAEEKRLASLDAAFGGGIDISHPLYGRPLRAAQPVSPNPMFYYLLPPDTAVLFPARLPQLRQLCTVAAAVRRPPSRSCVGYRWVYLLFEGDPHEREYRAPFSDQSDEMLVFDAQSALALDSNFAIIGHRIKSLTALLAVSMDIGQYPSQSLVAVLRAADNDEHLQVAYELNAVLEVGAADQDSHFWHVKAVRAALELPASAARILCNFRGTLQRIRMVVSSCIVILAGKKRGFEEMYRHQEELGRQLGQPIQVHEKCPHPFTHAETDSKGRPCNRCATCGRYTTA